MARFYSDVTLALYDSMEELEKAEAEDKAAKEAAKAKAAAEEAAAKKKADERAIRAKEVEEAYKDVLDVIRVYRNKVNAFCKDYGTFHMTIKTPSSFWF